MRIIVTGSRDWTNDSIVWSALRPYAQEEDLFITLVTGGASTGADYIAEQMAREFGWCIERYPAEPSRYGHRASHIRNYEMVRMGADVCLAFIRNRSRATVGCTDLCEKEGIPVVYHSVNDHPNGNRSIVITYKVDPLRALRSDS